MTNRAGPASSHPNPCPTRVAIRGLTEPTARPTRDSTQREYFADDEHAVHEMRHASSTRRAPRWPKGGDEPMNMNSAPDACALGALEMAQYLLAEGVEPVDHDDEPVDMAQALAVEVLEYCATAAHVNAQGLDDDRPRCRTDGRP